MTCEPGERFSFIQITDCHLLDTPGSLLRGLCLHFTLQRVLQHIARHEAAGADFILGTGDYVSFPLDRPYQCFAGAIHLRPGAAFPGPQRLDFPGMEGMPIYFVPGNHDQDGPFLRHLFPGSPAPGSLDFAFTHKGVRFLCLDTPRFVNRPIPPPRRDRMPASSMRLLERECARLPRETPIIIAMHLPAAPVAEMPWVEGEMPEDMDRVWELLQGRKVLALLHGHIHATKEREVKGVPVLGLRSTGNQWADGDVQVLIPTTMAPHFRVVTVEDGRLSHRNVEVDTTWGNVDLQPGLPMTERGFLEEGGPAVRHLIHGEPPVREW